MCIQQIVDRVLDPYVHCKRWEIPMDVTMPPVQVLSQELAQVQGEQAAH